MPELNGGWRGSFDSFRNDREDDNEIGAYAISLLFPDTTFDEVLAESITDGPNDKSLDILHVDKEAEIAVICQCQQGQTSNSKVRDNKAASLNQAITWIFHDDHDSTLRPQFLRQKNALRNALKDGRIRRIYLWFTHDMAESANATREVQAAGRNLNAELQSGGYKTEEGQNIEVIAQQVGNETLTEAFEHAAKIILVDEVNELQTESYYRTTGNNWEALSTAVSGAWLKDLYSKHGSKLFSANVREYLGSRRSDSNINQGIKQTTSKTPGDFFVFNNGVTALVNDFNVLENDGEAATIKISGISIVNGAQTTGAISSVKELGADTELLVPIRFIKTKKSEIIDGVIKFNNSQNKLEPADFRSREQVQQKLVKEFSRIEGVDYNGGRRGGASDKIRRSNALDNGAVIQSLASFHGKAHEAVEGHKRLWTDDKLYHDIFRNEINARHVIFCVSLVESVIDRRKALQAKGKEADAAKASEKRELELLNIKGAQFMIAQVIGERLSTILDRNITEKWQVGFISDKEDHEVNLSEAQELWKKPIAVVLQQSERFLGQVEDIPARITQEFAKEFSAFAEIGLKWAQEENKFDTFASRVGN